MQLTQPTPIMPSLLPPTLSMPPVITTPAFGTIAGTSSAVPAPAQPSLRDRIVELSAGGSPAVPPTPTPPAQPVTIERPTEMFD